MSVLFIYINAWSSTGGLQKFNRNFLTALEELSGKYEQQFYALSLHDNKTDFPQNARIKMYSAGGNRLKFIFMAIKLSVHVRKVIIGHINLTFPLVYLLPKPITLITHGIEIWRPISRIKKKSLKKIQQIITVSSFTKSKIEELFPFLLHKIVILPNTIDVAFEKRSAHADNIFLKRMFNLPDDALIVVTVCRLSSGEGEKGYDKVIECMPQLVTDIPTVYYILAGKYDAVEKERLDKIILKSGLKDRILFTGYVKDEDLASVYASGDVFIMPSKKEGFGIVFLEALLVGTPAIGGNKDGTRDALLNGETGLLIDPDNNEEIYVAIQSVLQKKAALRFFDKEFLKRQTLEAYGFEKFIERINVLINN